MGKRRRIEYLCWWIGLWMICWGQSDAIGAPFTSDIQVVGQKESLALREQVREAFTFTYDMYMKYAFPRDELKPLSCVGEDTLGSYASTLIDALDTLVVMGNYTEFAKSTRWIESNLDFGNIDDTVSLFETNIRVLGGLLSAHMLAEDLKLHYENIVHKAKSSKLSTQRNAPLDLESLSHLKEYGGGLLDKALDLGKRLSRAFEDPARGLNRTLTGIPFGAVNLKRGVNKTETEIASTAGATTLAVEFGVLSRLTENDTFEELAINATRAIWSKRSKITGLVGAHINVTSGSWTHMDAGIGSSVDSYYEYLLKGNVLLGIDEFSIMFHQAYSAVEKHLRWGPWYVELNMENRALVWPVFNALQAFWPGMQSTMAVCEDDHDAFEAGKWTENAELDSILDKQMGSSEIDSEEEEDSCAAEGKSCRLRSIHMGYKCSKGKTESSHDLLKAIETHSAMLSVWQRYGSTPEGFSLTTSSPMNGQRAYPLRPELIESTYYLYLATRDPSYLSIGRNMLSSIQTLCRTACGFASLDDVSTRIQRDHMESFFLAETLKYLYLLFDAGSTDYQKGGEHKVVPDLPHEYIFSTEGHIFPLSTRLSQPRAPAGNEHAKHGERSASFKSAKAQYRSMKAEGPSSSLSILQGYCRPIHPIWDAPRYIEHRLPTEEEVENLKASNTYSLRKSLPGKMDKFEVVSDGIEMRNAVKKFRKNMQGDESNSLWDRVAKVFGLDSASEEEHKTPSAEKGASETDVQYTDSEEADQDITDSNNHEIGEKVEL